MQRDIAKLPAAGSGSTPTPEHDGEQQQPWPGEIMLVCHSERFLVEAESPISYLIRWESQLEPCDSIHPSWEAGVFRIYLYWERDGLPQALFSLKLFHNRNSLAKYLLV